MRTSEQSGQTPILGMTARMNILKCAASFGRVGMRMRSSWTASMPSSPMRQRFIVSSTQDVSSNRAGRSTSCARRRTGRRSCKLERRRRGRDFAAKYADAIFAIQPREDAAAYFADIKGRMAELGRDPDDCKILFGLQTIIGGTESEAHTLQEEHNKMVPAKGRHDDSIGPPRLRPGVAAVRCLHGRSHGTRVATSQDQIHGQSVGLPQFVGTARSVADQREAFIDTVGGDGFMLSP